jgi:hypothetical protein
MATWYMCKAVSIKELQFGDDTERPRENFARLSSGEKEQALEAFSIIRRVLDSEIGAGL